MTQAELYDFMARHKWAVEASVFPDGRPQAAVVGVVVTPALEVFFDTLDNSRKCKNLRHDPRLSLVIGWDEGQTVQFEGKADEPKGEELERLLTRYFERFPDGRERRAWPGITYFCARPTWIRYSDFRGAEPQISEFRGLCKTGQGLLLARG